MIRQRYLFVAAIMLICLVLSSCSSDNKVGLFRYDVLDPLYHQLSNRNDIAFELDRELMQRASESSDFIQLSTYQAYCISTVSNQPFTPVLERNCIPVILLDKTKAIPSPLSFEDLLKPYYYVGIYNSDSDMVKWLVHVINQSRGGPVSDLSAGYAYFAQLKRENRLFSINYRQDHDPLRFWLEAGVDAIICWDYQAEYLNQATNHRFQIAYPQQNVPTKQYLAYRGTPAEPLPPGLESAFKAQGFTETNIFQFSASQELMKAYSTYKPDWRRQAMGSHTNTTASVNEKFFLNALVLLLLVFMNTSIFLKAKNRRRIFIAYLIIASGLLMWQFLWLIKTLLWEDHDPLYITLRYCAYPLIMSAAMAWRVLCYELRWDRPLPKKWLYSMIALNIALTLLVFTNAIHQQFFVMHYPVTEPFWYNDYSYNWGYWLFYTVAVGWLLIGAYDYFLYAVTRERRKQLMYFLIAIAGTLAINFIVVFEDVFKIYLDVAWQTSLLTAFFVNMAIRNRFLDQGLDFAVVLDRLNTPVAIISRQSKLLYHSDKTIPANILGHTFWDSPAAQPTVIEHRGRNYRPEYHDSIGRTVVLFHDITYQIKLNLALQRERDIAQQNQQLLEKRARSLELAWSSINQLIINERLTEVFDELLNNLIQTLKRLQNEDMKPDSDLNLLAQAQVSRSNRLLRLMLWDLQDESISSRQMADLLRGECEDACMRHLDMVLAIKNDDGFPGQFAYEVYRCIAMVVDMCLEAGYEHRLLVRIISSQDRAVLVIFLSTTSLPIDKLEEFSGTAGGSFVSAEEDDTLTIRIVFGKETDS